MTKQLNGMEIRQTEKKGKGIFAMTFIPKGTFLTPCNGFILKSDQVESHHMCLQSENDEWICSNGDHFDDYFNHSCNPNIGFLTGDPVYYSLNDIQPDEELCWDYSSSISELGWNLSCRCGSVNCRKTVKSFFELTVEEQKQILPYSLNYIRKQLR